MKKDMVIFIPDVCGYIPKIWYICFKYVNSKFKFNHETVESQFIEDTYRIRVLCIPVGFGTELCDKREQTV